MKFWHVAIFVLAFNLSISFVTNMPLDVLGNSLDDSPFNIAQDNEWNVTERLENGWNASSQNLGVNNLGFGDIPGTFNMMVGVISDSTVTMNIMLESFGIPPSLAIIFAVMANLTYLAGAILIWSGRDVES